MISHDCILVGAPVDTGKGRQGCLMGPDAYRTAGLGRTLKELGHGVRDLGNVSPAPARPTLNGNCAVKYLPETIAWAEALQPVARGAARDGFPVFLGGDHAMSIGTVAGVADHAAEAGRPLFLLWLDAHTDLHTPETSGSGNLHGTPMAYLTGTSGFDGFPEMRHPVPHENICMIGLRSVDLAEKKTLASSAITALDMRAIDEHGIAGPLARFLDRVRAADGLLHVSLDVDCLEPAIAPGVGTTVPGGVTFREAHLIMEMLHDSGLVTSLDLAELNPFLDERGRTATLMVDLTASLMGRRVFDRPTRRFQ